MEKIIMSIIILVLGTITAYLTIKVNKLSKSTDVKEMEKLRKENERLNRKIESLEEELKSIKSKAKTLEEESLDLKDTIHEMDKRQQRMEKSLSKYIDIVDNLVNTVDTLTSTVERMKIGYDTKIGNMQISYNARIEALENEVFSLNNDNVKLVHKNGDLIKIVNNLDNYRKVNNSSN